jgi:hypothetical protein
MEPTEERIRFAVRFAQLDPDELRPGDWMNLREELAAFLGVRAAGGHWLPDLGGLYGFYAIPSRPPRPSEMSEQAIRALQGEVRALLAGIADSHGPQDGTRQTQAPIPVTVTYTTMPLAGARRAQPVVQGSTRDLVLHTLIQLIVKEDVSAIRRCPEDERLFYRVRRQAYCSRTCVNRANKRTWRENQDKKRTRGKRGGSRSRGGSANS